MIPHHWNRAAANNGSADPNADLRPGRPANTVVGAIRGLMATGAAARDDAIGGLVATLGASNVYSVGTNEGLIDITTGINGIPAAITAPFLLRLSFDTALSGSTANVPHLKVDGFDCGPILRRDGSALADGDLAVAPPVLVLGDMAAPTDTKVTRVRVLDLVASDILALIPSALPIGAWLDWPSIVTPPNFIEPVGALLSRTDYAALWAFAQASGMLVADSAWSANPGMFSTGDGATTFRTMDVRGDFFRALDGGRGIDSGRTLGSFQADAFKSHTHALTQGGVVISGYAGVMSANVATGPYLQIDSIAATGGSETRPRNTAYRKLLKYK